MEYSFKLKDKEKIKERLGINPGGKVQKIIDYTTMHYLKLLMPMDSGQMITNTRSPKSGLIVVNTPYAHYMNEGILYVDPISGKGAFHNPISGRFWSRPGVKKIPSGKPLNYHGGANRGAHFVERTIEGHFDDILNAARKGVKK